MAELTFIRTDCYGKCHPVKVDTDEFEIIKLMVLGAEADVSLVKAKALIDDLERQGYARERARNLVLVARAELRKK